MKYYKDEEFIRGNIPMTKEEIRILSIARLEIQEGYRVLDIGAGTGSVAIQIASITKNGQVIALEKNEEACSLIHRNKDKFSTENLSIIHGEALEASASIEGEFDAIFIGGSGGNISEIIKVYGEKLKKGRNMVLNFITIDNLYKAIGILVDLSYEVECIQLAVNKLQGKSHMLMANNPIFIVKARKCM